jgi:hypothetical protein
MPELKEILKQKLLEKRLERTSQLVRENKMDKLEERIKKTKNKKELERLQTELEILEKVEEKQLNSFTVEFPEYGDGASYGGGMEHPN